jgi:2-hydroxychromene-2-carboxylate isomerase
MRASAGVVGVTIECFFDCSCVWAWLAFEHVARFRDSSGVEVTWRPVLAADVFAQVNRAVHWPVPGVKQAYYARDLPLWAEYLGMGLADQLPEQSDMTECMLACVAAGRWGRLESFARAAMDAAFAQGRDLDDRAVLADVWNEAGLPPATFEEGLNWSGIAAELAANTRELTARGGFGVPTFFLGHEMFFGNDSIPLLERAVQIREKLG